VPVPSGAGTFLLNGNNATNKEPNMEPNDKPIAFLLNAVIFAVGIFQQTAIVHGQVYGHKRHKNGQWVEFRISCRGDAYLGENKWQSANTVYVVFDADMYPITKISY
jgi:hypothetical protein